MKDYLIFMLALLLTSAVFSQTEEDYEKTLNFIKVNYNENKPSLIYEKFDSEFKVQMQKDQFVKTIDNLRQENGAMQGYEFLIDEEGLKNYLVEFMNASMLIVITLKEEGAITAFEIKEY